MSHPTLTHNLDNEALINLFRMDIRIYHSANTVELYLDALMRFSQSIKGNNLLDVTKQDIMTFFRRIITNEYSQSYINLHNAALRAFYNTMKKFHIINNDRSLYLPRHRSLAGKKLPRFLGEGEIARVIEAGPDVNTFKGIRDRAILELLYSTGIRAQELLSLYSGDIDINSSTLYITAGKGDKPRVVPVGCKAIEALKAYLAVREKFKIGKTDVLFLTMRGRPIRSRKYIWDIVNHYCLKTLGRSGYSHLIRHTCATHELENGMDIRYIQEQLGHKSLSTTAKYTHVDLKYLKGQHSKLFGRQSEPL